MGILLEVIGELDIDVSQLLIGLPERNQNDAGLARQIRTRKVFSNSVHDHSIYTKQLLQDFSHYSYTSSTEAA